jgi:2-phosphosulfolactate phosphatase
VGGAVVVVDVLRAFTTAAYALGAGAARIVLVSTVEEALDVKGRLTGALAMGEDGGRKPPGFDFSNSPVEIASADIAGRVLVQRTSAGTQGVFAAPRAARLWCASLVCASATAAAVAASRLGTPTYVITGRFPDRPEISGSDDLATARLIERVRSGQDLAAEHTRHEVATSDEAVRTLALGEGHVHPDDITAAVDIDRFDFAMEVLRAPGREPRLERTRPTNQV